MVEAEAPAIASSSKEKPAAATAGGHPHREYYAPRASASAATLEAKEEGGAKPVLGSESKPEPGPESKPEPGPDPEASQNENRKRPLWKTRIFWGFFFLIAIPTIIVIVVPIAVTRTRRFDRDGTSTSTGGDSTTQRSSSTYYTSTPTLIATPTRTISNGLEPTFTSGTDNVQLGTRLSIAQGNSRVVLAYQLASGSVAIWEPLGGPQIPGLGTRGYQLPYSARPSSPLAVAFEPGGSGDGSGTFQIFFVDETDWPQNIEYYPDNLEYFLGDLGGYRYTVPPYADIAFTAYDGGAFGETTWDASLYACGNEQRIHEYAHFPFSEPGTTWVDRTRIGDFGACRAAAATTFEGSSYVFPLQDDGTFAALSRPLDSTSSPFAGQADDSPFLPLSSSRAACAAGSFFAYQTDTGSLRGVALSYLGSGGGGSEAPATVGWGDEYTISDNGDEIVLGTALACRLGSDEQDSGAPYLYYQAVNGSIIEAIGYATADGTDAGRIWQQSALSLGY